MSACLLPAARRCFVRAFELLKSVTQDTDLHTKHRLQFTSMCVATKFCAVLVDDRRQQPQQIQVLDVSVVRLTSLSLSLSLCRLHKFSFTKGDCDFQCFLNFFSAYLQAQQSLASSVGKPLIVEEFNIALP